MNIKKYLSVAINHPASVPWQSFYSLRRKFPLDYFFLNGWSFPPDIICLAITKKCNFTCPGCCSSSPEYTRRFKGSELGKEEIKTFIKQIAWFKPLLYFSGGEPMMRDDFFELVGFARSKGLPTATTTNGSFLNKKNIDMLLTSGPDFISFSLDYPSRYHDRKRGEAGSYRVLVRNINKLLKRRKELKKTTPLIKLVTAIDPGNVSNLSAVLGQATNLGVDEIGFYHWMFYPRGYQQKQKKVIEKLGFGGEHINGLSLSQPPQKIDSILFEKMIEKVKKEAKIPVSFLQNFNDYSNFYSFNPPSPRSRCLTPWFVATLLPDGNLSACQEFSLGKISDATFFSLWNGPKMKEFRRYRKKENFPACFRCLEGQAIKFN